MKIEDITLKLYIFCFRFIRLASINNTKDRKFFVETVKSKFFLLQFDRNSNPSNSYSTRKRVKKKGKVWIYKLLGSGTTKNKENAERNRSNVGPWSSTPYQKKR